MINRLYPTRPIKITTALLSAVCVIALFSSASASNLTFQGQNAALFPGANPADTSMLMNSVPKPSSSSSAPTIPTVNPATLVEQSLESQISSKIYNDIFTGSNASGFFNLGDGNTINYLRSGGDVTITIVSPTSGTTTITVPDI